MIRIGGPLVGPEAPAGVVVAECVIADVESTPLHPEEVGMTARVVEVRRREIVAGRACARAALTAMGLPAVAIPAGKDRAPIWPAGVVGTIAHSRKYCAVMMARTGDYRGVGLDIEPYETVNPDVAKHVASDDERAMVAKLGDAGVGAKLVFSAKEAFYKCQYAVSRTFLGFMDVAMTMEGTLETGTFEIELGKDVPGFARGSRFRGTHVVRDGHLVCVVTLPND